MKARIHKSIKLCYNVLNDTHLPTPHQAPHLLRSRSGWLRLLSTGADDGDRSNLPVPGCCSQCSRTYAGRTHGGSPSTFCEHRSCPEERAAPVTKPSRQNRVEPGAELATLSRLFAITESVQVHVPSWRNGRRVRFRSVCP